MALLLEPILDVILPALGPFELHSEDGEASGDDEESWPRKNEHGDTRQEDHSTDKSDKDFTCVRFQSVQTRAKTAARQGARGLISASGEPR